MLLNFVKKLKSFTPIAVILLFLIFALIPQKSFGLSASDDFNRADGSLGTNWTDMSDGGMAISNQTAQGGTTGNTGDMWNAATFGSDQFSQIETTAQQPAGTQWIGPSVRSQNGGQNDYLGIYYWNSGSPDLMMFKRISGGWTQLGATYNSGTLPAGTTLEITAVGSTISFLENGVTRITATDTSLTGGAPGIMSYGNSGGMDNWSGGDAAPQPGFSIGGTVSGLSGTVVLQDNGSDNLSVSANGNFTFNTPVATGAPYNVTVAANPNGQSCAVTNGSGVMGSANVTNVGVTCTNTTLVSSATDDFNRADGSLGSNWTNISDGGMAISGQTIVGTNGAGGLSGDMRTGESYSNNQYSQIEMTSTQLSGGQWVGPIVRAQNNGQDFYLGLYDYNNGTPYVQIFKRTAGNWSSISGQYASGPLGAGTQIKLEVVGQSLSLLVNGVERETAYDTSIAAGAPGVAAFGAPTADNWAGGTAGFEAHYTGTDTNGVETYNLLSANNGYGEQQLRVLRPTNPTPGVPHNVIFTLPVQPGADNTNFGDGLDYLQSINAQNQYNLTIVEPSFAIDPWYADNPTDANEQEETFLTTELVPWVKANLYTTGSEQNWLIGFSKSGIGGADLLLKHPDLFSVGAFWDFPADMASYSDFGSDSEASYGTDANFQANYRLTQSFVDAHKTPFLTNNRIWLGGYNLYGNQVTDFDSLLTSEGIQHTMGPMQNVAHSWTSGWVPAALTALSQDSNGLGSQGSGQDTAAPTTPTNLTASAAGSNEVDLSWTASSDNVGVTGYQVYRNGTLIATLSGSITAYADTTVSPATSYSYTVAAFDAAGNTSAQSAAASATTPAPADNTPPTTPGSFSATINTSNITLKWTASTDNVKVTGYQIYRNGAKYATKAASARSYADTNVVQGNSYTYSVAAFDAAGNVSTPTATITKTFPDKTPPTQPTNLKLTPGTKQITLNWTASTDNVGVTGYKIYRGTTLIATVSGSTTTYTNTGLKTGTTYSYHVIAVDAAGNKSTASATVSATAK